ncbi:MAG: HD domain-containing phosphohydrolase [Clostridia bacterium]
MESHKIKILAIDDHLDNLITLKAVIQEMLPESEVFVALSGRLGLEIAKAEDPDVILLDILMPEMDGFEVCQRLKKDGMTKLIPVIFLTALKTSLEIRIRAIKVGAEAFLAKPLDELELMLQIQAMAKVKASQVQQIEENKRLEILVKKRTEEIQNELFRRVKIERDLRTANQKLVSSQAEKQFIIQCQKELLEISEVEQVYSFIGKKIKELIGEGYTIVGMLNEKEQAMEIVAYEGFTDKIQKAISLVGFNPLKLNFYLSEMVAEDLLMYQSGSLEIVQGGLYQLLCKKVPKAVCKMLEHLLQLSYVYAIGFVWYGEDLGGLTILAPRDIEQYKQAIEIIVNQAALTINRISTAINLQTSEERYRAIFEQSPMGISITDSFNRHYYSANKKFTEITGYSEQELLELDWMSITHPDDVDKNLAELALLKEGKISSFNMNKRYFRHDGSEVWINMTIAQIKLSGQENRQLCMIEDITEKKAKEELISYLSYHDTLTGLFNRTYYEEACLQLDISSQLPLSIITGDINGLKLINDTLGHAEGDKLIVEMAKIITSCTREKDIVARIGGDEFSILLPRTNRQETETMLNSIYTACNEYKDQNDKGKIFLSMSLGAATKYSKDELFDNIEKIAEDNMYRRKLLEHKSFHSSLIASIRATLFEKSHETEEHAMRLVAFSKKLGIALKLKAEQMNELELLATLHDIGKISIGNHILNKPDKLTEEEWQEMKMHPAIGYRIAMASPELEPIAEYILCHHERWDGKGYPQGLAGIKIPLLARIISVVDAYDAMTEDRPYRVAMSCKEALLEIAEHAGTQFDPTIASLFLAIQRKEAMEESPNRV